uniref:C2 domain-containing protein n=1 Tax=Eutreptiella gymnastica TaxID=73025 RepID=A0A7S1J2Q0_9EUGL
MAEVQQEVDEWCVTATCGDMEKRTKKAGSNLVWNEAVLLRVQPNTFEVELEIIDKKGQSKGYGAIYISEVPSSGPLRSSLEMFMTQWGKRQRTGVLTVVTKRQFPNILDSLVQTCPSGGGSSRASGTTLSESGSSKSERMQKGSLGPSGAPHLVMPQSSISGSPPTSPSPSLSAEHKGHKGSSPAQPINVMILVVSACNLHEVSGEVYLKFQGGSVVRKTSMRDARAPVWNEEVRMTLPAACTNVEVCLMSGDKVKGEGSIPTAHFDMPASPTPLDLHSTFWHKKVLVGQLQLSLRRLPQQAVAFKDPTSGDQHNTSSSNLELPGQQTLSPRIYRQNSVVVDNESSGAVPWIIVTPADTGSENTTCFMTNSVLQLRVIKIAGLLRPAHDWIYVKVTYGNQCHRTSVIGAEPGKSQQGDITFGSETLNYMYSGEEELIFNVVDIIEDVLVARAVVKKDAIDTESSKGVKLRVPLTISDDARSKSMSGEAFLKVYIRYMSSPQAKQAFNLHSMSDPHLMVPSSVLMELKNKDQKIREYEVCIERMQQEIAREKRFERMVPQLQSELARKQTVIKGLMDALKDPTSQQAQTVLAITVHEANDLDSLSNALHVRLEYKNEVQKTTVKNNPAWNETLCFAIPVQSSADAPTSPKPVKDAPEKGEKGDDDDEAELTELVARVCEGDTTIATAAILVEELGIEFEGPSVQVQMELVQTLWGKRRVRGTLDVTFSLRTEEKRADLARSHSKLPIMDITVLNGIDMKGLDSLHVQLTYDQQTVKTSALYDTFHPVWNEVLTMYIPATDPPEELTVEVYDTDICIGTGTLLLSDLEEEGDDWPIAEVPLHEVFLHRWQPAGSVRLQVAIHSTCFGGAANTRKAQIYNLEQALEEKDGEILVLTSQLAITEARLAEAEKALGVVTEIEEEEGEENDQPTSMVFLFTIQEVTGLQLTPNNQYYVRLDFDQSDQRTTSIPCANPLAWNETLKFKANLATLEDEVEVTVFQNSGSSVAGSMGAGCFRISDFEFEDGTREDVEVSLLYDDQHAGTLKLILEYEMDEEDEGG